MGPEDKGERPERADTGDSLREERLSTDQVGAERNADLDGVADEVVEHARAQADGVLQLARNKADEPLGAAEAGKRGRGHRSKKDAGRLGPSRGALRCG